MNLKSIGNLVTSKAGRQILKFQKHSPTVLFVAGVIGIGATVVLACRSTLKVDEVLDEHHDAKGKMVVALENEEIDYTADDYKKDHLLLLAKTAGQFVKLYGPSVVIGVTSIAALTGAHVVLNRRNVALTAAYAAVEKGFREYRQRVMDEYGDEKDRQFRHGLVDGEIVEETAEGPKVVATKKLDGKGKPSIYARFFDEYSTSYQENIDYNRLFVRAQQSYANDLLKSRGHVFLNEVYDMLGLSHTKEGAVVGWVLGNGDDYIDFGVFRNDEFMGLEFARGNERSILLDFNVDGVIYDLI